MSRSSWVGSAVRRTLLLWTRLCISARSLLREAVADLRSVDPDDANIFAHSIDAYPDGVAVGDAENQHDAVVVLAVCIRTLS